MEVYEAYCVNCGKRYRLKADPEKLDILSLRCPECGGALEIEDQERFIRESFFIDRPLALVYWDISDNQEDFLETLHSLGFEARVLKQPSYLGQWLRFHTPTLLVMACEELKKAALLFKILDSIPSFEKRDIFLIWISPKVRTLDPRQALIHSVHLVVNTKDLPRFKEIYNRSRKIWEEFYAPFRRVQEQIVEEAESHL